MKYTINTYDPVKDVADVTINYKYKTVAQTPLNVRAHNVPVDDKDLMDAWALGWAQAKKQELRQVERQKAIAANLTGEQTVADSVDE
jgi:hypothetical protein